MNKLKLNVDALQVDSFAPDEDRPQSPGTVHGRQATSWNTCNQSCGCPVTDLANTCTCPDTTARGYCFCTEYQTCWNCDVA